MSALPDPPTEEPTATTTSQDAETPEQPRHLHAVDATDTTSEVDTTAEDSGSAGEVGHSRAATTAWLRAAFTPRSGLYTEQQPAIAETVRRAHHGSHLPAAGPLRTASRAHGYLSAANKAVAHTWVWIVDHPARLTTVTLLLTLALAFPATRQALSLLLAPFSWAHHALG